LKTPQFWHKRTIISYLLLPFSLLYILGHLFNYWRKIPTKINKPIVCIGNLVSGGAGKTPTAIAIGRILSILNIDFAYLTAGYGGKIKNFELVNKDKHNSKEVGDEPLLLSEISSTFVAKNRLLGAKKIARFPDKKLILMDDGLQNPNIIKDFSILVIDGNYGFGNGFLMPAGALREPIKMGIDRADLIIIIDQDRLEIAKRFCSYKKVLKAKTVVINQDKFFGKNLIAFCGIGRPEKFFASLKNSNINIISRISYSDHHQYKFYEIEKMLKLAKQNNAKLVTTKKDWVRLEQKYQQQIDYLEIKIEFEDESFIKEKLLELINEN
jgi:tetraacyldisaccharide 4'-kinase